MALTVKPNQATAVLLAGAGWQVVQKGTLRIDMLELTPPGSEPEAEDYGFTYKESTGGTFVTGRLSALLAIRE